MHLYIGNWVVDDLGDYCKITRIIGDSERGHKEEIWGIWSNHPVQELRTSSDCIVGKYRTKKEAMAVADIVRQQCDEEYLYG